MIITYLITVPKIWMFGWNWLFLSCPTIAIIITLCTANLHFYWALSILPEDGPIRGSITNLVTGRQEIFFYFYFRTRKPCPTGMEKELVTCKAASPLWHWDEENRTEVRNGEIRRDRWQKIIMICRITQIAWNICQKFLTS